MRRTSLLKSIAIAAAAFWGLAMGGLAISPGSSTALASDQPGYNLSPQQVADGVYVFFGHQEALTPENGANIANTGFIVGDDGVLIIEAGPTRRYAMEMLAAIRRVTDKPLVAAIITHQHPDHAFGIHAFTERGIDVVMHEQAAALHLRDGEPLLGFMSALIGDSWTEGTEIGPPSRTLTSDEQVDLGNRVVSIVAAGGGHTPGDLVVIDRTSGTLFAGDIVFQGRTPTIPHAHVPTWLDRLEWLQAQTWSTLVPGHGPLVNDPAQLAEIKDYLTFLTDFARAAYERGDSPAEALLEPLPERFAGLAVIEAEFQRSILDLFKRLDRGDDRPATLN